MVGSISKHAYVPRQATYKNIEPDEKTLTSLSLCFGGRTEGESTLTIHEILSVK